MLEAGGTQTPPTLLNPESHFIPYQGFLSSSGCPPYLLVLGWHVPAEFR